MLDSSFSYCVDAGISVLPNSIKRQSFPLETVALNYILYRDYNGAIPTITNDNKIKTLRGMLNRVVEKGCAHMARIQQAMERIKKAEKQTTKPPSNL